MVSVLLIGSALLRIGVQTGPAWAQQMPPVVEKTMENDMDSAQGMVPAAPLPEDLQLLVNALQNREQRLDQRQAQIQDQLKALEIADKAIEQKLAALIEAEQQLSATLTLADGASEADLTRLTEVYQTMKPKEAAALFEEMAPEFAAGFLGRMRADSAASIMSGLAPKTAYTLSVILAGRNAWVPKE